MKVNIKEIFPDLLKIVSIVKENELFYIMIISLKNDIFKEITLDNMFNCITEQIIDKNDIKFTPVLKFLTIENDFLIIK